MCNGVNPILVAKVSNEKYLKRLKFMCVIRAKIKSKSVSHKTEITKQPSDLLTHLTSSDLQNNCHFVFNLA